MVATRNDDRGQLLLVSAIAVALVLFGIVVVLNSTLFVDTVGSTAGSGDLDSVSRFDREAGSGVGSLVLRLNHERVYRNPDDLDSTVEENVRDYSALLAESYAESNDALVGVSYDASSSTMGERLLQPDDGVLRTGDLTTRPARVGWFTLNLDTNETRSRPFTIRAEDTTSGKWVNISVNKINKSAFEVTSSDDSGGSTPEICRSIDNRLLLDLAEGRGFGYNKCTFDGTNELGSSYTVSFNESSSNAVGKYELVAEDSSDAPSTFDCSVPNAECSPAVWEASVTTTYESERTSYERTQTVPIYNSTR